MGIETRRQKTMSASGSVTVSARSNIGGSRRRGCLASAAASDKPEYVGRGESRHAAELFALWSAQRGFSSIETTVILIAFVALAAVFSYSVMSTGILASKSTTEAGMLSVQQATAILARSGPVIGESNTERTALDSITFQVSAVARGTEGVDLSPERTTITYVDEDQAVYLTSDEWTATWLIGFGALLNPGERVEITVDLSGLNPRLGPSRQFNIQLTPGQGITLVINKTTPAELAQQFMDLP